MDIQGFKQSDAKAISTLSNSNSEFFQYPKVSPVFIRDMCAKPGFKMFVLRCGGADSPVVGFCGANFASPPTAELGPICVAGGLRKRGYGEELAKHALDFLKQNGITKVFVKVKRSNVAAQKFFKSLDFKVTEQIICGGEEALVMRYGKD